MNKELKILTAVLAVVLVLTVVLIFAWLLPGTPKEPVQTTTTQAPQTTAQETTEATTEATTQSTTEPTTGATTEPATEVTTEPTEEATEPPETTKKPTSPPPPKPTNPPATELPEKKISFPYSIPGTNLVIQKLDSYDGVFLEDGSDRDVTGIAAMVIKNTGSTGVEYAKITLTQGDRELVFTVAGLCSGAQAVVQESSAAAYQKANYQECTAEVAELASFEMSESLVKVTENTDGSLSVTNLTQQTIPCVRVFYKFCLTPGSAYVGGITYTAKLTDLAPGQTQEVTASHYASGYSEVVMVRTYETAE